MHFQLSPSILKPFLLLLSKTGCGVVAEEHSVYGGLGSAVSELCAQSLPVPLELVGVRDTFGKSGEFGELMSYFHLDAPALVQAVKKVLGRKYI